MTQYRAYDQKYGEIDFERRYKCRVSKSSRYQESYMMDRPTTNYGMDHHYEPSSYTTKRVHLLEISITEESLTQLKNDLREIDLHKSDCFEYRAMFAADQKIKLEEKKKRDNNPAAAKAYEKYLLLLNMTADSNGRS